MKLLANENFPRASYLLLQKARKTIKLLALYHQSRGNFFVTINTKGLVVV